ncbi:MAG: ribonuclease J [Pseudomonadota bacterium]
MNLALYGYGKPDNWQWIMVDCGVTFAAEEHMPGVDLVFPDISFVEEERANLLGVVLTHAHEDHYGALPDLWPRIGAPVYATPFTASMLEAKIAGERGREPVPVKEVELGATISLGPFEIELVTVAHSIPEPNALAITTPLGTVVHTGDWKLDPEPLIGEPTNAKRLEEIGAKGCRAIICDSTNVLREGTSPSEGDVARGLKQVIAEAPGRVAVTCFASNLARIQAVADAAADCDRDVVVVGRAMHRVISVGRMLGLLNERARFVDESAFGYLPPDKAVLLCTGSQGEPRAALTRIAYDRHQSISFSPGDRLIYSARVIPGNDREVGSVLNALVDRGVEVITDRDALVHVSGHPRRGELKQMYDWLKPEVAVPVHGEAVHLHAHAHFAREAGISEVVEARNGDMIRLAPGPAGKIDETRSGRIIKDGQLVLSEQDSSVRERRKLARVGLITVAFAIDGSGDLAGEIEAEIDGVPALDQDGNAMIDITLDAAEAVLAGLPRKRRMSADKQRDIVQRAVRAAVADVWGKKPIVHVHVVEI